MGTQQESTPGTVPTPRILWLSKLTTRKSREMCWALKDTFFYIIAFLYTSLLAGRVQEMLSCFINNDLLAQLTQKGLEFNCNQDLIINAS